MDSKQYKILDNGCWQWQLALTTDGYGQLTIRGHGVRRFVRAHRHYYELTYGDIPQGLVIDHLCRNHACVNPAHLEAVTTRVNSVVRGVGPAAVNARKTHCKRGHLFDEANTKKVATGRECRTCQAMHHRNNYQKSKLNLDANPRKK